MTSDLLSQHCYIVHQCQAFGIFLIIQPSLPDMFCCGYFYLLLTRIIFVPRLLLCYCCYSHYSLYHLKHARCKQASSVRVLIFKRFQTWNSYQDWRWQQQHLKNWTVPHAGTVTTTLKTMQVECRQQLKWATLSFLTETAALTRRSAAPLVN